MDCCCSHEKKTPRDEEMIKNLKKRLNRIAGQINGVSKMIDELGLKGKNQNDAEISTIHAGFIVNKAKATCKDVLFLIEYIRKEIKSNFNEDLELEIELVGDKNDFEGRLSHTHDL